MVTVFPTHNWKAGVAHSWGKVRICDNVEDGRKQLINNYLFMNCYMVHHFQSSKSQGNTEKE